jgi:hypothetical protein
MAQICANDFEIIGINISVYLCSSVAAAALTDWHNSGLCKQLPAPRRWGNVVSECLYLDHTKCRYARAALNTSGWRGLCSFR